jgi:hypothetical protein
MHRLILAILCASFLPSAIAQTGALISTAPTTGESLRIVQTLQLPSAVQGNFDHFGIDLKRNRLFATPEDFKAVLVFDLSTGKIVHQIDGIARPHAVFYRPDLDQIYVSDGGDGSLKIYDGETYRLVDRIALLKDADSIGYDISRKYLYIDNGGGDVDQPYSMLSVVDTTEHKKIADVKIDGDSLEAMALDNYRPRIYVNDKAKNQIVVVNRLNNTIVATWPLTMGKVNVAMALDEQRQRLFVGCRSGQIVVLDTNTGKELQALPISKGVDDLIFDPVTRRIYAAGDGAVDVLDETDLDHYVVRGTVPSGAKGKTARLVPELNRLFVAVPGEAGKNARIIIFEPLNTQPAKSVTVEPKAPVDSPISEKIVLDTLSTHPFLRKLGLHVIPPDQQNMVLVANGNATRIGIRTTEGDFGAVKDGKTYCAKIDDGAFYNIKMQMFDAQGRRIGILVMEIPYTSAVDVADAIHQAENIREEVEHRIPSLEALFHHA